MTIEGGELKANSDGSNNDRLMQQIILITDGIQNEEELTNANVILRILNDNMMAMYGVIVGNWYQSEEYSRLIDGVNEMVTANIDDAADMGTQLNNDVYQYISNYVIDDSNFMPSGGEKDTMLMPNRIVLLADAEILQGAVLKIEYRMPVTASALYGTGGINNLEIVDNKNSELSFSKEERLITDPSKTNEEYGWEIEEGQLVTRKPMSEARLVLSSVLSTQKVENVVYDNSATCRISFDVGGASFANYTRTSTAMEVQVLPPFGEEKEKNNDAMMYGIIVSIVIMGMICVIVIKKKRNNKKNGSV